MFCPKCAKINPDGNELCSNCGAVLRENHGYSPVKKNGAVRAILTILLVVAVVVAVVVLLNGCDPGNIRQDNIYF